MSMSVNVHNSTVHRVSQIDDKGTMVVRLGEYPTEVAIFIRGGADGFSQWITDLISKFASENYKLVLESEKQDA